MDRHTLENKIMRIERELLALKTACERGLGAISFYLDTYSFTPTDRSHYGIEITVRLENATNVPRFMQICSSPFEWTFIEKFTMDNAWTARLEIFNPASLGYTVQLVFGFISSAKVDEVSVRYV